MLASVGKQCQDLDRSVFDGWSSPRTSSRPATEPVMTCSPHTYAAAHNPRAQVLTFYNIRLRHGAAGLFGAAERRRVILNDRRAGLAVNEVCGLETGRFE